MAGKLEVSTGLNGAAKAVFSTVGAAATVVSVIGGILFKQVYADQNRIERQMTESENRVQRQVDAIVTGRIETAERIRALEAAIVEIETQFRALSTVQNLERQRDSDITDLLQQCPTCKLPAREYYPPGPGPNGNGRH